MPRLSKTRFQAGLQCTKRLWLDTHRRELATPPDAATRRRLSRGHDIGKLAHGRWPGGVLVEEAPARHARAVERTRALLDDESVPAVFEAAFEHDGVRVRADVVARNEDGFDLIEVKSSSRAKPEHATDVGIQAYVLDGAGVALTGAYLLHLDTGYVWQGGDYDVKRLFALADLTEAAFDYLADAPAEVARLAAVLDADAPPAISVGRHCRRPFECPFIAHCWAEVGEHHVLELPRASDALLEQLARDGIEEIAAVEPGAYDLTELQERVRAGVTSGRRWLDAAEIARRLDAVESPACFLDFETFAPALPLFEGTRPYEVIPFQWSAHLRAADGDVEHREFLWTERGDPRPAFVDSLLRLFADSASIVVYSGYEESQLERLAEAFPSKGGRLLRTFRARGVDLLRLVRQTVYDPAFRGSFSLKSVLPVLVPGAGYQDLAIAGGADAALAYEDLRDPATPVGRRKSLERALKAYCRRDTEAELKLFEALRGMAQADRK